MKITTISYMERKNKGNYEHEEISASANVDEGESFALAMTSLKNAVHAVLHGIVVELPKEEVKGPVTYDEETKTNLPVEEVKAKKAKAKKEKVTEVKEVAEGIVLNTESFKEEKVKPSKVVKYSSTIPEHKSIFGGYLAKSYGEAWKTASPVEEIKKFTASLNGQDFLNDSGTMVPTFLELVHTFFGMPTNA